MEKHIRTERKECNINDCSTIKIISNMMKERIKSIMKKYANKNDITDNLINEINEYLNK